MMSVSRRKWLLFGTLAASGFAVGRLFLKGERPAVTRIRDRGAYRLDLGAPEAATKPVVIIEFGNFTCQPCNEIAGHLTRIVGDNPGKVAFSFRHIVRRGDASGQLLALAALAAENQGRLLPMYQALNGRAAPRSLEELVATARRLGLDADRFRKEVEGRTSLGRLALDMQAAAALKVTAVPTVFINGRRIVGAEPYRGLKAVVSEELQLTERLLASGVPLAQLHAELLRR